MKEMSSEEITGLVKEILKGDIGNLQKLKWLLIEFFRGKTQQELDRFGKDKLYAFSRSLELLKNKEKIFELDKAYLEEYFGIVSGRYVYLCSEGVANKEKLSLMLKKITKSELFDKEEILELEEMFKWAIEENNWIEEAKITDRNKEFEVDISFTPWEEQPKMNITVVGVKKREEFCRELIKIVSKK